MAGAVALFGGILLLVAAGISLITVGVLVAAPYIELKDWKEAVCTVTKTNRFQLDYGELQNVIPKFFVPCVGDHTADNLYEEDIFLTPCTDIEVTYTHPKSGQVKATLYSDVDAIGQDTWNVTCFKTVCQDDEFADAAENEAEFTAEYGVKDSEHVCYYSDTDKGKAIVDRFSRTEALVGMIIPGVVFVIGLILTILGSIRMCQGS